MKKLLIFGVMIVAVMGGGWWWKQQQITAQTSQFAQLINKTIVAPSPSPTPIPTPTPTPTPSPTPRPLTFAEMNQKYGPCVSLPILMYHHIQTKEQAENKRQTSLTVFTPIFAEQMQYLKDKGYTTITPKELADFFDHGNTLPTKSVMITIDDGYEDNYTDAYPILKNLGLKATIFLATGLMENTGYLTWSQINEMNQNGIYFGNHTWSHQNMQASADKIAYELSTAETQLEDRGLNSDKIFAFPYGTMSGAADNYLTEHGYNLAFDTVPGRIQCAQKKYALTRIRIGNASLNNYGL